MSFILYIITFETGKADVKKLKKMILIIINSLKCGKFVNP